MNKNSNYSMTANDTIIIYFFKSFSLKIYKILLKEIRIKIIVFNKVTLVNFLYFFYYITILALFQNFLKTFAYILRKLWAYKGFGFIYFYYYSFYVN